MIQLENFTVGYDDRVLINNATTAIDSSMLTALIGRNGCGKSTLLRSIAGLNRYYVGNILLDCMNQKELTAAMMARKLAFVTTERIRISNLRCKDVVAIGRAPYTNWIGRMQECDRSIVAKALADVGMSEFADRTMDKMSDGECQRVMIARALAQETPIILLDEPTSFLDMPNRYELAILLRNLAHEQNKCIVFSTHELDIATRMCDNILLIDNKSVINLSSKQMLQSGNIERLFKTDNISFNIEGGQLNITPLK
jgi:iron complex transport system ATP-binding protein